MTKAVDVLKKYMDGCNNSPAAALAQFAPDVVLYCPCMPEPYPKSITGLDTIGPVFTMIFTQIFKEFAWHDVEIFSAEDPSIAFGRAKSRITLVNGEPYTQDYTIFSRVKDGKIIEHYEFFDSVRAAAAFKSVLG